MSELPEKQIKRLRSLLQEAETNLAAAKELLNSVLGDGDIITAPRDTVVSDPDGKIIEGVFDGQIMIGPDGKFLYKQIGPVERKSVIGTLTHHDDKYYVEVAGREYEILYASVTYFHLREGSQVSVVIPAKNDEAQWAAVEAAL